MKNDKDYADRKRSGIATDEVSSDGLQEADGRIEGEFHYATQQKVSPFAWFVFRKPEGGHYVVKRFEDYEGRNGDVRDFIAVMDAAANHFIEVGAQAERERINGLGERAIWIIGDDSGVTSHVSDKPIVGVLEYFAANPDNQGATA